MADKLTEKALDRNHLKSRRIGMEKIDFVLTWVDGSDPDWLAQRRKYQPGRGTDAHPGEHKIYFFHSYSPAL